MGGLAFSSDGLSTPRMPPNVYYYLLSQVEEVLKSHFKLVGHPLEAPAKTSHGDVDVLVAEPVNRHMPMGNATGDFLAKLLGATRWKRMGGSSTYNLAVPWPEEFQNHTAESICKLDVAEVQSPKVEARGNKTTEEIDNESTVETMQSTTAHEITTMPSKSATSSVSPTKPNNLHSQTVSRSREKYIQVDINIMPTSAYFNWHMFFHAHGDLWNMLGGIIRRFGLTSSSKGLCVRIAEVEKHNKEQARILASSDPNTVLEYLGLDKERFWQLFDSWDEMLAYVATCRFHNPAQWKSRYQSEDDAEAEQEGTDAKTKPEDKKEPDARPVDRLLKANDRQRAAKRPLFGYWIETYLPTHVDDTPRRSAFLTREEVLTDAKQFFGPDFAQKFDDRKTKMVRQIGVDKLWVDIRKGLPVEGTEIGYVMKGMKSAVVGKHGCYPAAEVVDGLEDVRKAFEESRFDEVLEYARVNWKAVGERQKRVDNEQSRVHMLEKIKKGEMKAKEQKQALQSLETLGSDEW